MPFLGVPLLVRVVRRLSGLGDELWVASNDEHDLAPLGLTVKTDPYPGVGALGGLYTALSAASFPIVVVVACDMPFIRAALLRAQIKVLQTEAVDVVIPRLPEGFEPFHAVYRRETCLPAVQGALLSGRRRMVSWFAEVKVRELLPEEIRVYDKEMRSFMNVNDPTEFARAEQLARGLEGE